MFSHNTMEKIEILQQNSHFKKLFNTVNKMTNMKIAKCSQTGVSFNFLGYVNSLAS